MSELHEDLLAPRITKKRVIAVIIVTGFLISFFTFSVYLTSFLFGTQRIDPSERVEDADYDEYLLVLPPLPDDFKDLLDDINLDDLNITDLDDLKDFGIDVDDISPEDLEKLAQLVDEEDIADFLEEMNDGDIDNYDLTEAGLLIAALLFSDVEVFRVFEYDNSIEDREDILWRYECFDQFNGDGWESTVPKSTMPEHDFPTLEDYYLTYSHLDKIKLERPLSTNIGTNSFVMGSLFPEPYIIEETISADNLNPDPALSRLYKDDLESVIADLYFNSAENVSMYYELFGWGLNPKTNEEINNTAVNAIYTPSLIKSQFLQLPPNIGTYKTNNYNFNEHWNALNSIINATDNAFMVANKIRNYLQSNFELSFDELINDPPAEGEDVVEWFCEKEEGLYSEFASAFSAFTRSFGVASRFVDGYNSRLISEEGAPSDPYYTIKYKNIYNWAEIYVPWDTSGLLGHGQWVQMDILYDSFGLGGSPITEERYNITVTSNATQPDFIYERGEVAKITTRVNSSTYPVNNKLIFFEDITTERILGTNTTDDNGVTSIEVPIDNSFNVGPHVIKASLGNAENYTYFIVNGEVNVNITQLLPQEVNVSIIPHETRVRGFVEDALTHQKLSDVKVNFLLLYKGTNNPVGNPFSPMSVSTDSNGFFDEILFVHDYVPYGQYDFRVDFNGTWTFPPIIFLNINNSSDRVDFNVTKELTYDLLFSINGQQTDFPFNPNPFMLVNVKRYDQLNFSVIVVDAENGSLTSGVNVEFYDYTNGDVLIGSCVSGSEGNASILYTIGNSNKSGPTLVYTKVGRVENYSYYVVNESIGIDLLSYTTPLEIDLAGVGPTQFNIQCELVDDQHNSIYLSQLDLRVNRSIFDYTSYLTPSNPVIPTPIGSHTYNFDRGVFWYTPINNYSLRVEFNGHFDFTSYPYPFIFDLIYLGNTTEIPAQLEVYDWNQVDIYLAVEDNPTRTFYDEFYQPEIYTRGEIAHFNVTVVHMGGVPASGTNVTIWDEYSNELLYTYIFNGVSDYVEFNISTDTFYYAGIHKIRVQFEDFPTVNTTFILINEAVQVHLNQIIRTTGVDNVVLRENGGFIVSGYITENDTSLRGLQVRVLLLNSTFYNVSHFLVGDPFDITNSTGNFTIQINSVSLNCPYGEYYIRVDFNGSIMLTTVPGIDLIPQYMSNVSSPLITLNITAGTSLVQVGYYTDYGYLAPGYWINEDILHVLGVLEWDNGIGVSNVMVNVTVQYLNGTIIAYNSSVLTDGSGNFHGLLTVDLTWPSFRSDTQIVVYFEPKENNLYNVERSELLYT